MYGTIDPGHTYDEYMVLKKKIRYDNKYDKFMEIMGEFGCGRSVTVIAFYLLASQLAAC
jgi:ABC-type dipeptide/oligopeptide/nickel transport system ATPase component